ncbi:MAG: hypothetical protein Q7T76_01730 [Ferruginibacter sp.]|nr:hypothetical protein [Ferruginibacter sp.]
MKNFLIYVGFGFLAACNNVDHRETGIAVKKGEEHHHPALATASLSLNGQLKWKADQATFQQVKTLHEQAVLFASASPIITEEFRAAGDTLQSGLNKLIRNCKMTGEEHEALHHWLEPLLQQVKALRTLGGAEGGQQSLHNVQAQLELFDKYFEQ